MRKALDFRSIEDKWRKRWAEAKLFEADAEPGKEKFFATFPYPYMNGFLHIGHFYTLMRVEVTARYQRLRGKKVLFPQGWHCTGSPIEAAAQRIREREPKQWESMRKMGFSDEEIERFSDPEHWTRFFPKEAKKDYERMGMSVDFRRSFITTSLNPHYDSFIKWQFRKLKERGYVVKGEHPVVWDPVTNTPVGDHDRVEGEGEVPQEFLLVRHKLRDGRFLISATLRQDTILGITNLYVHPDIEYEEIEVKTRHGKERWILGEAAAKRLEEQGWEVRRVGKVKGEELIGEETEEFGGRKVPVLPATFLDPKFGTGLVHSVPSDSADDLIALWDLQKNEELCRKHNLDIEKVRAIRPIPILETEGIGGVPAEHFLKKENVKNQNERKKLDRIRKELYKLSFYAARFGNAYKGVFPKDIVGKPVQEEKEYVKQELIRQGWVETYYQLTGRVVSRNLNECVVRIVRDQWFIKYSDPEWKKLARKALEKIRLFPEKARPQFEYVIGWLNDWACVREKGLGTRLPWDEKWVIESLSDSTIYMAYYTISHILQKLPPEKVSDELFDYVFLGKGSPPLPEAEEMRKEFLYWYPLDFRNSGKDLIQNHLAFFIFNHVAIFPEKHWPRGIGVNGWVTVDGKKMSKSLGNIILLREMADKFSVDASRLTIMSGGEGLDDPNWDSAFAKSLKAKLEGFYSFCTENYGRGREEKTETDEWMLSKLNEIVRDATNFMDMTLYRSASQKAFFELNNALRWYLKRTGNKPNKELMKRVIESQVIMLSPFTPYLCEEIWEAIGKEGFVSNAKWPEFREEEIREDLNSFEKVMETILSDVHTVLRLAKISKPKKITLFVAEPWKYELASYLKKAMEETRNPAELIKGAMRLEAVRKKGKEAIKTISRIAKSGRTPENLGKAEKEKGMIKNAAGFLEKEFNAKVLVVGEWETDEEKARQAMPGKPAILAE